jgi:hypothetical protein
MEPGDSQSQATHLVSKLRYKYQDKIKLMTFPWENLQWCPSTLPCDGLIPGPGARCRNQLEWAQVMLEQSLAALARRGLHLPAPMAVADRWFGDSNKLMRHVGDTHHGTLLVQGKSSYAFTPAEGHKVKGCDLLNGDAWPWQQSLDAPACRLPGCGRTVRLMGRSPCSWWTSPGRVASLWCAWPRRFPQRRRLLWPSGAPADGELCLVLHEPSSLEGAGHHGRDDLQRETPLVQCGVPRACIVWDCIGPHPQSRVNANLSHRTKKSG